MTGASRPRVLAVRLSAMGDVVHATGAIEALARARPDVDVDVVVQAAFAPLFVGLPHVAEVIAHRRQPAVAGLLRTLRALRGRRYEVALDLQGNWKSAIIARWSGARRCLGIAGRARRERASAVLLREKVHVDAPMHPHLSALAVVRAFAPECEVLPSRLVASEAELEAEREALGRLGIDGGLPFLCLVLGDPADNRSWPAAMAARAAAARPWPALVLLGPQEPVGMPLPAGIPVLRHAPGEVRRLVALGALLARAGGVAVGPDQGPTHVLSAAGATTTAVYGPQDPTLTRPFAATAARRADGPACVPCRRRVCHHPQGPVCMQFAPDLPAPPRPLP